MFPSIPPGAAAASAARWCEAAEQWLAARGVAKVHLTVRATNAAVVRFYERIGYGALPSVLMEKALRKPD